MTRHRVRVPLALCGRQGLPSSRRHPCFAPVPGCGHHPSTTCPSPFPAPEAGQPGGAPAAAKPADMLRSIQGMRLALKRLEQQKAAAGAGAAAPPGAPAPAAAADGRVHDKQAALQAQASCTDWVASGACTPAAPASPHHRGGGGGGGGIVRAPSCRPARPPLPQMERLRQAIEQKNLELQRVPKPGGAVSASTAGRSGTPPAAAPAAPPARTSSAPAASAAAAPPGRLTRSISNTQAGVAAGSGASHQQRPGSKASPRRPGTQQPQQPQEQQREQQQQREQPQGQQQDAAAAADAFLMSLQAQQPMQQMQQMPGQPPRPLGMPLVTPAGLLSTHPLLLLNPLQQMFVPQQQAAQLFLQQPGALALSQATAAGMRPPLQRPPPPSQQHQLDEMQHQQLAQMQGVQQAQAQAQAQQQAQQAQAQQQSQQAPAQPSQPQREQHRPAAEPAAAGQDITAGAPKARKAADAGRGASSTPPRPPSAAADLAAARAAAAAAAAKAKAAKKAAGKAAPGGTRAAASKAGGSGGAAASRDPESPLPRPSGSTAEKQGTAAVTGPPPRQQAQQPQPVRPQSGADSGVASGARGPLPPSLMQALLPAEKQRAPPSPERQLALQQEDAAAELAGVQVRSAAFKGPALAPGSPCAAHATAPCALHTPPWRFPLSPRASACLQERKRQLLLRQQVLQQMLLDASGAWEELCQRERQLQQQLGQAVQLPHAASDSALAGAADDGSLAAARTARERRQQQLASLAAAARAQLAAPPEAAMLPGVPGDTQPAASRPPGLQQQRQEEQPEQRQKQRQEQPQEQRPQLPQQPAKQQPKQQQQQSGQQQRPVAAAPAKRGRSRSRSRGRPAQVRRRVAGSPHARSPSPSGRRRSSSSSSSSSSTSSTSTSSSSSSSSSSGSSSESEDERRGRPLRRSGSPRRQQQQQRSGSRGQPTVPPRHRSVTPDAAAGGAPMQRPSPAVSAPWPSSRTSPQSAAPAALPKAASPGLRPPSGEGARGGSADAAGRGLRVPERCGQRACMRASGGWSHSCECLYSGMSLNHQAGAALDPPAASAPCSCSRCAAAASCGTPPSLPAASRRRWRCVPACLATGARERSPGLPCVATDVRMRSPGLPCLAAGRMRACRAIHVAVQPFVRWCALLLAALPKSAAFFVANPTRTASASAGAAARLCLPAGAGCIILGAGVGKQAAS